MKKFLVPLMAALLVFPAMAFAKTFPVPDEDPVATISLPEKWDSKPYDGGVESTSEDGQVYVAVEMVKADDVKSATEDGIEWFAKQGVEIDPNTLKTKDIKVNGLDAFDMSFSGKDKDGPAEMSMTLVATNAKGKFLMLYYWGSPEGAKANLADLEKIAGSLQATK